MYKSSLQHVEWRGVVVDASYWVDVVAVWQRAGAIVANKIDLEGGPQALEQLAQQLRSRAAVHVNDVVFDAPVVAASARHGEEGCVQGGCGKREGEQGRSRYAGTLAPRLRGAIYGAPP